MIKVTINKRAIVDILKSAEMRDNLRQRAERIAAAAGPGHRVETETMQSRARAAVITDTREARRAEAKSRTLSSAVDAGR